MRMTKEQLLVAARTAAKYLPSASADIMTELANRLDVASVALSESLEQRKALLAEISSLKKGPQGFFAYSSACGYEEFDTAEKAMECAENEISDFRGEACDGWSDEVTSVVWGIVMQRATMTGLRPVTEDDNVAAHIEEWCDYTLLPRIEASNNIQIEEATSNGR